MDGVNIVNSCQGRVYQKQIKNILDSDFNWPLLYYMKFRVLIMMNIFMIFVTHFYNLNNYELKVSSST